MAQLLPLKIKVYMFIII